MLSNISPAVSKARKNSFSAERDSKSAIAIARQLSGKQRNFNGENFWARGYAVSTVELELEAVCHYIREQEIVDKGGQF